MQLKENQIQQLFSILGNEIGKPWNEQNLDTLYLLINLQKISPKLFDQFFLTKSIGTNEIICKESLNNLCQVLLVST